MNSPKRYRLWPSTMASARTVNGIGIVCLNNERPSMVVEVGGPLDAEIEVVPAGIQPPRFAVYPETGEGDEAKNVFLAYEDSSTDALIEGDKTYYLCCTFYSSRYGIESNPSSVGKVTLSATQNSIKVQSNEEIVGAGGSNIWKMPPENGEFLTGGSEEADRLPGHWKINPNDGGDNRWFTRHVDRVRFYRTLANPKYADTIAGSFYEAFSAIDDGGLATLSEFGVPLWSFTDLSYWDTGGTTPYYIGDVMMTNKPCSINPAAPTNGFYMYRYRCIADIPAALRSTTFSDEYDAGYWQPIGASPIILREPDTTIATDTRIMSVKNTVPPDAGCCCIHDGRMLYAGQEDYSVNVVMTQGSSIFTIARSSAEVKDRETDVRRWALPTGAVGREFSVVSDGGLYVVKNWINYKSGVLDRPYEGVTTTDLNVPWEEALIRAPKGAIYYSEVSGDGLVGTTLPASVPRTNVVVAQPDDGRGIIGLAEGTGGYYYFKSGGWGWGSDVSSDPKLIEEVAVYARSQRNIARGRAGEVFFISDDGIRMATGPFPSRIITQNRKDDLWFPRADTVYAWNKANLSYAMLSYFPGLDWLVMFGPQRINAESKFVWNDLGLIWDRRNDAFYTCLPFNSTTGSKATPNFTFGESFVVNGRDTLHLFGSIAIDTDDDDVVDTLYVGRAWEMESNRGDAEDWIDQIPHDKDKGWPTRPTGLSGTASDLVLRNHPVLWTWETRPIIDEEGGLVGALQVEINSVPVENGGTYSVQARVLKDNSFANWVYAPTSGRGRIDRPRAVIPSRAMGRSVTTELSGVRLAQSDNIRVQRILTTPSLKGGRGTR